MTSHEILSAFGKPKIIHEITGADPRAIRAWKRNGIPAKYWHEFVQEAEQRGIPGVTFDTLKATKPPKIGRLSEHVA